MTVLPFQKTGVVVFLGGMLLVGNSVAAGLDLQNGAEVYGETCVACHGENGKGEIPGVPDFTSKDGPLSKSDEILIRNVTNGFISPGAVMEMPALGGNPDLTQQDVKDVIAYLRKTFQK